MSWLRAGSMKRPAAALQPAGHEATSSSTRFGSLRSGSLEFVDHDDDSVSADSHSSREGAAKDGAKALRQRLLEWLRKHPGQLPQQSAKDKKTEEHSLAKCMGHLRTLHAQKKLSTSLAADLEALPQWKWTGSKKLWHTTYNELKEWLAAAEHAQPDVEVKYPSRASHSEELKLSRWVESQRAEFRKGVLSTEREKLLSELPKWKWLQKDPP